MTRLSLPALLVLLVASAIAAVTFGPADITPGEVWSVIAHHLGLLPESPVSRLRDAIVWELRLPRVLTALCVGAGLALSGAVMQAITRNPLADPYLLGLSSGAALGAVSFALVGLTLLMPLGAFFGSLGALALALLIAGLLGGATPSRAILAGICIAALASAATSFLIFWSATGDSYREILSWLMGSLSGSLWFDAALASAALVLCTPIILAYARALDAFAFGDTAAASLGIDVPRLRWTLLGATALLTGIMVAIGGAIGFVGLVVPHAVRLMTGSRHRALLPHAMLAGAIFMLWTDTAARTLFDPRELPVGIITALIGAPVFLFVLLRYRRVT
ncbi:iron chelate uptake ABC transporter family permease subunit [Devosia sp. XJ19-1]|uniref:Iron chelate uptake ABC transporter family permease subunit n=1 Tax=Devosia ureilytica TaxID=2952754 RepID=A0A9Q4FT23_9HYPH|nr:putative F420-0 ABC transporter permease subunit [Devosia ureilytica]MCP8884085.1 iron chelate uptake ABC transporter family permease subunit [Devosia ureilytica]MCP8887693.1 iron chelate uptake ABC transporter family permease subunit [Devosia ureilytica]